MTRTQKEFLANMTAAQANALMAKFDNDPLVAFAKSDNAYSAFAQAFELLNPNAYIQQSSLAGGIDFTVQYVA
tara:strand:- start:979 stop:1197 length:219 start_codon:yes stop_codon:yes gene_type:complete